MAAKSVPFFPRLHLVFGVLLALLPGALTSASAGNVALFYALESDWQSLSAGMNVALKSIRGGAVRRVKIGNYEIWAMPMAVSNVETAM
jgi:hypothetical protein